MRGRGAILDTELDLGRRSEGTAVDCANIDAAHSGHAGHLDGARFPGLAFGIERRRTAQRAADGTTIGEFGRAVAAAVFDEFDLAGHVGVCHNIAVGIERAKCTDHRTAENDGGTSHDAGGVGAVERTARRRRRGRRIGRRMVRGGRGLSQGGSANGGQNESAHDHKFLHRTSPESLAPLPEESPMNGTGEGQGRKN